MKTLTQTENIKHGNNKYTVEVTFSGAINYTVWAQDKDTAEDMALEEFDTENELDKAEAIFDVDATATKEKTT